MINKLQEIKKSQVKNKVIKKVSTGNTNYIIGSPV